MDDKTKKGILFKLKFLRRSNKITLIEVAEKMGSRSSSWLSEIEKKGKTPMDEFFSSYIYAIQILTGAIVV
jgi:transcriptional regulator with XRE-family HTH domain